MSMASELVATIRTQIAELAQARAAIAGARNSIAEVLMEVQQWTDGTSDPRPAEAITRYQVGLEALEAAESEIAASEKALEAYVAHLLGSGTTGGGSSTSTQNRSSSVPPTTTGPPPRSTGSGESPFHPDRLSSERVDAIKRLGWPKNAQGRISARALFFDRNGNEVFRRPLRALPKDSAYDTPELKDAWNSPDVTTTHHIEGGIAKYLRDNPHITHAALYINIPPCGAKPPDPKRCHVNLPSILPAGAKVTVWIVRERGMPERRVYEGTGEAIK